MVMTSRIGKRYPIPVIVITGALYGLFWLLVYFFGPLFAVPVSVSLLVFVAFASVYPWIVFWETKWLAAVLTLITLVVFCIAFANGAVEGYCWKFADRAPDKNVMYGDLSPEEREFMGAASGASASVSGWLRVHLRCDATMDVRKAVWELVKHPDFGY